MKINKLKIALITPPIFGHKNRGIGIYTEKLFHHLKAIKESCVDLVDYNDNLLEYDVVHYPYFDPFFLTLPLRKTLPTVVTVHDLIPLKFPEFFPRGVRGEIKWKIQKRSLLSSSMVITDSFASKHDIIQFTGVRENKIKVIYLGVGDEFKVITDKNRLEKVKKKLNLPQKFILYVGDVNYNKNIPTLINAFHGLLQSVPDINLILVGHGFLTPFSQLAQILQQIETLRLQSRIRRLDSLTREELSGLYNLAKVYVQPSLAEGFGLPVLEAMACGCPTVVSDTSSLPELSGDASMMVDPGDKDAISRSISEIITREDKREEIISRGLQRVKKFTWEQCARETINVYRKVINDKR